jgi:hypothetical protein
LSNIKSTDQLLQTEQDVIQCLKKGDFDEYFTLADSVYKSFAFLICKELMLTGDSTTLKALQRKTKKAVSIAEKARDKDSKKLAIIEAEELRTQEETEKLKEADGEQLSKISIHAGNVHSFAFANIELARAARNHVDIVWCRDSAKLNKERIVIFNSMMSESGMCFFAYDISVL